MRQGIQPPNNGTEMHQESRQVLGGGHNIHLHPANVVVELHHPRLPRDVEGVLVVGVLVGTVVRDGTLVVVGRHDVDVIVHRLGRSSDVFVLEEVQLGLGVLPLQGLEVVLAAEV